MAEHGEKSINISDTNGKEAIVAEMREKKHTLEEMAEDMFTVGLMNYFGKDYFGNDTANDIPLGLRLIRKSAEIGYERAVEYLPKLLYQSGKEDYKAKRYEEAFACFKEAADLGHTNAQAKLAVMYYNGRGVEYDGEEAYRLFLSAVSGGIRDKDAEISLLYFETVEARVKLRSSLLSSQESIKEHLPRCVTAKRRIKKPRMPKGLLFTGIFRGIGWGFAGLVAGLILYLLLGPNPPSGLTEWASKLLPSTDSPESALMALFVGTGAAIGFVIGYMTKFVKKFAAQSEARRVRTDFHRHKDEFAQVEAERVKNADRALEVVKRQHQPLREEIARVEEELCAMEDKMFGTGTESRSKSKPWDEWVMKWYRGLHRILKSEKIRDLDHLLQRHEEKEDELSWEMQEALSNSRERERVRAAIAEKAREEFTWPDLVDAGLIASTMADAAAESGGVPSILAVYADPDAAMALAGIEQRQAERVERALAKGDFGGSYSGSYSYASRGISFRGKYLAGREKEAVEDEMQSAAEPVKICLGDEHPQNESRKGSARRINENKRRKGSINRDKAEKLMLAAMKEYNSVMIEILLTHPMVETMPGFQITATRLCRKICDDLRSEPSPNIKKDDHAYSNHKYFVSTLASYGDPEAILALERCGFMSELWKSHVSHNSRKMYEHLNRKTV